MKESYKCELPTHFGPESCGAARKGSAEALTEDIQPRKTFVREQGRIGTPISRGVPGSRAVKDPEHVRRHLAREPGEPRSAPEQQGPWDASGSLRTHADEERTWEVGQTDSTHEVTEQHRTT